MIAGAGGKIASRLARTASSSSMRTRRGLREGAGGAQATHLPMFRYIINVDAGAEFVGGNEKSSRAGYTIFTNALGNAAAVAAMTNGGGASILFRTTAFFAG